MCGRFAVTIDPARLAAELHAVDETGPGHPGPNYNVAPTTDIVAVVARHDRLGDPDEEPTRRIRLMRWGLLPNWVKPDADGRPLIPPKNNGRPLINARAETLTRSPAFRAAAEHKRCLVPMDGYYEWMPNPDVAGRKTPKTPFYLHRTDGRPLLVAGLWSAWGAGRMLTCAVVTTAAVGQCARVHDRMPLLLEEADWDRWLDPDRPAPTELLAAPPEVGGLALRPVSTLVNKVANNGPELIEPVDVGQPVGLFQPPGPR